MPELALNKEHDKEVGKRSVLSGRLSVQYYFKWSSYDEEVGKKSVLSNQRSVQYSNTLNGLDDKEVDGSIYLTP